MAVSHGVTLVYVGRTTVSGRVDFEDQDAIKELSVEDIEQVSGGVLPLLLAFAAGAAIGAYLVERGHHH